MNSSPLAAAPTLLDRIDACSALPVDARTVASLQLYNELDATDGVPALVWRAMGIELGACAHLAPASALEAREMLRARAADCHARADTLGRVAARTLQLIPVLREVV